MTQKELLAVARETIGKVLKGEITASEHIIFAALNVLNLPSFRDKD